MRYLNLRGQERPQQLDAEKVGVQRAGGWGMPWAMLIQEGPASLEGHLYVGRIVDKDHH